MSKIDLDNYIDFMAEYKKEISKDYEEKIERLNKEIKELNKICSRKSHYIDKKRFRDKTKRL